jgi:predicted transposase YbfD/YdcC
MHIEVKKMCIVEELKKATGEVEYQGYTYRLSSIIEILILGLMCRMKTLKDIHYWSTSKAIRAMLKENFHIRCIPCYSHFTVMVGMIDAEELNKIFMGFFGSLVGTVTGKIIAIDGKTVCSTANMKNFESALNIANAFVVENGITIGQLAADSKSNEIPIVRELIRLLDVEGSTIVADALHCQEKTAKEILDAGADYVLSVKKNQPNLYEDISEIITFKQTDKCEANISPLEKKTSTEKGHGRIDTRTAFVTHDVQWLDDRCDFIGIKTIGAISTKSETRHYISSRILSADELLTITRQEWAVESMHWQLDVLFDEDITTLREQNTQLVLNILRKAVLNVLKIYRDKYEPKLNIVDITRKCLHDTDILIEVLNKFADC